MGQLTKLSFASKYGISTAVFFLIQTTFSAAKICDTGVGDELATPWSALSNLLLGGLYCGFFAFAGCREVMKLKTYYLGGLGLYTLGYFAYGLSSLCAWTDVALDSVGILSIVGGASFTFGSFFLLTKAIPPWGNADFRPSYSLEELLFGPPVVWWGCLMFQIGSLLFLIGGILDKAKVEGSLPLYEAGILIFVPGRVFFLASSIVAIQTGREFRYGSNAVHLVDVAAGLKMGARLFAAMRQVREARRPRLQSGSFRGDRARERRRARRDVFGSFLPLPPPASVEIQPMLLGQPTERRGRPVSVPERLPGGSWPRKARKDEWGRYGSIEVVNGELTLTASLRKDDGTYVEASTVFRDLDTFTCVDGEFVSGCALGLTTREVVFMCDLYDEMDIEGIGFLAAPQILNFVNSLGLRHVTLKDVEKLVKDLDADAGTDTLGRLGLTFPEFLMLVSRNTSAGYTYATEMNLCWNYLARKSSDEMLHLADFRRFAKEAKLDVDDHSLHEFLQAFGQKDAISKEQLFRIFTGTVQAAEGQPLAGDVDITPIGILTAAASPASLV